MQQYPEPCVSSLGGARMLVYSIILSLLIIISTGLWLIA